MVIISLRTRNVTKTIFIKNKEINSKFVQYLNVKSNDELVIMFNKFIFPIKEKFFKHYVEEISYYFYLFHHYQLI